MLDKLSKVLNRSRASLLEDFIGQAFAETQKKYPKDFK